MSLAKEWQGAGTGDPASTTSSQQQAAATPPPSLPCYRGPHLGCEEGALEVEGPCLGVARGHGAARAALEQAERVAPQPEARPALLRAHRKNLKKNAHAQQTVMLTAAKKGKLPVVSIPPRAPTGASTPAVGTRSLKRRGKNARLLQKRRSAKDSSSAFFKKMAEPITSAQGSSGRLPGAGPTTTLGRKERTV